MGLPDVSHQHRYLAARPGQIERRTRSGRCLFLLTVADPVVRSAAGQIKGLRRGGADQPQHMRRSPYWAVSSLFPRRRKQ